ncbi:MAG: large repetitive protein, partial [Gaiellaceae bacterium]|nr:large repetitive protein [Gaiellaceae bacterium]
APRLDISSVTDLDPEFTVTPAPGAGTITLDATRAPILVSQSGNDYTFRYFYNGTLRNGQMTLTFIGGSVTFLDASNNAVPLFAPRPVSVMSDPAADAPAGQLVIDVAFGTIGSLDSASITDPDNEIAVAGVDSFTFKGATTTPGTYRYIVAKPGLTAGSTVTVSFVAGTWTYTTAGAIPAAVEAPRTVSGSGDIYLDVVYPSAGGIALDASSITDSAPEFDLSGAGSAGVGLDTAATRAPTLLADGQTVRYYLTGAFAAGPVGVTFKPGTWADVQGNVGVGSAQSFRIVEPLQNPEPGTTPSKVFFIEISGGVQLWLVPITSTEPVLEIRGKVTLEFGSKLQPDGSRRSRFTLNASGTVDVYKIGNIASGAASFVLETGDGLSSVQFWGVAAFDTNFDFLHQYGIDLKGSVLLAVNTTDRIQTETLTLEGIPGGVDFVLPTSTSGALIASLPTDTFNPVAINSAWVNAFASPGDDRNFDGFTDPTVPNAKLVTTLFSGQALTLEQFGGVNLAGATIEGIQPGLQWRIVNGDGRQFWVEKQTDVNGLAILIIRGEERTYDLAAKSFEFRVVGGLTLKDPTSPSTMAFASRPEWFHMDGAFLIRITSNSAEFFITAGASITPLHLDGRITGLLIARGPPRVGTSDPAAGLAAMFQLEITAGTAPGSPSDDRGSLSVVDGVFSFTGRVQVMLNTTRQEQTFVVPQEFLSVLPAGFPTSIKIFKSAPGLDGQSEADPTHNPNGAIYISALIQGTVTLGNVVKLAGFVGITLQGCLTADPCSKVVRISGAVSTNIQYLGALSGSIDLFFYADRGDWAGHLNPGIVGRVTLGLQGGGIIPGVSISGQVLLEINMFLHQDSTPCTASSGAPGAGCITIKTFQTNKDAGRTCTSPGTCDLLATNETGDACVTDHSCVFGAIKIGDVTIASGLRIVIAGKFVIASVIEIEGRFVLTFTTNPSFSLSVEVTASMKLGPLGSVAVAGGFIIDGNGLAALIDVSLVGNFGGDVGLKFDAHGHVQFNTGTYEKEILGTKIPKGFLLHVDGSITFLGFATANGVIEIALDQYNNFTLFFNVSIKLGPFSVKAEGFAGIYGGQYAGVVLRLAVAIDISIADIIKIDAKGELQLNTTGISRNATRLVNGVMTSVPIGAKSFRLSLDGDLSILDVITFKAHFLVQIGGGNVTVGSGETLATFNLGAGEWVIDFGLDVNFFGLATMHAQGWINSQAHFDVKLSGNLTLGSSSFGLVGGFSFR